MSALPVRIRSRISSPGSTPAPRLQPGEVGIRLAAVDLAYDEEEGELHLDLLVSFAFPRPLWDAYRNLAWAITVTVENAATGQAGTVQLKDPYVRYADDTGPNTLGPPVLDPADPSPTVMGRELKVPLRIETRPATREPSIFIRAALREHTSNTLTVDAAALTVVGAS